MSASIGVNVSSNISHFIYTSDRSGDSGVSSLVRGSTRYVRVACVDLVGNVGRVQNYALSECLLVIATEEGVPRCCAA